MFEIRHRGCRIKYFFQTPKKDSMLLFQGKARYVQRIRADFEAFLRNERFDGRREITRQRTDEGPQGSQTTTESEHTNGSELWTQEPQGRHSHQTQYIQYDTEGGSTVSGAPGTYSYGLINQVQSVQN